MIMDVEVPKMKGERLCMALAINLILPIVHHFYFKRIAITVASSSISAILLANRRSGHSGFKLLLNIVKQTLLKIQ